MPATIRIAAAALTNRQGQVLLVRKRGTTAFMQPGGKIDVGETPDVALVRELDEELGLKLTPSALRYEGALQTRAANEPDANVHAELFAASVDSPVAPGAEIVELLWYPDQDRREAELAPLTRCRVLPAMGF
ncbi:MAG: NUDIX domain-containing protein [Cohaesibacteraceae bacterium]